MDIFSVKGWKIRSWQFPPKCSQRCARLHDVIFQKTLIFKPFIAYLPYPVVVMYFEEIWFESRLIY
jgi:hypothetical protein